MLADSCVEESPLKPEDTKKRQWKCTHRAIAYHFLSSQPLTSVATLTPSSLPPQSSSYAILGKQKSPVVNVKAKWLFPDNELSHLPAPAWIIGVISSLTVLVDSLHTRQLSTWVNLAVSLPGLQTLTESLECCVCEGGEAPQTSWLHHQSSEDNRVLKNLTEVRWGSLSFFIVKPGVAFFRPLGWRNGETGWGDWKHPPESHTKPQVIFKKVFVPTEDNRGACINTVDVAFPPKGTAAEFPWLGCRDQSHCFFKESQFSFMCFWVTVHVIYHVASKHLLLAESFEHGWYHQIQQTLCLHSNGPKHYPETIHLWGTLVLQSTSWKQALIPFRRQSHTTCEGPSPGEPPKVQIYHQGNLPSDLPSSWMMLGSSLNWSQKDVL